MGFFSLQLMASHEQELEDLAERLETDRDRQYLNLRDKLAQKRKRKMDELRRKQDVDLTKEMIEQKKEMDEIRMKQVGLIGNIGFIRFWVSTRQTRMKQGGLLGQEIQDLLGSGSVQGKHKKCHM